MTATHPVWAFRVAGLHFSYPSLLLDGHPIPALRGIDLEIAHGAFVAVMGPVGAGKSTLCFALNGAIPHAVDGECSGRVTVYGQDTRDVSMGQLAMQVGLVFEDVEAQLFNATVADEVAFGLESMGLPVPEIETRIEASLERVGLAGFSGRVPRTLSGGEQKRVALASVLAMVPRLLILDEPTAGLDPRGRHEVLAAIDRLRDERETGMTVVMATQDAEAAARYADHVVILDQGRVVLSGPPGEVFAQVERLDAWGIEVPQLARLAHQLGKRTGEDLFFLRLQEAQQALGDALRAQCELSSPATTQAHGLPVYASLIEARGLSYRYPSAEGWALSDVDLDVGRGEWLAVVGVNGSGKSTLVKHFNGLLKPSQGAVRVEGQDTCARQVGALARTVGYLPQNPDHMIFTATVRQEVAYGPRQFGLQGAELDERVQETLAALDLLAYAEHPPAVLGYGLRRQVALASVLAMGTPVLALDEPTVGLDRGITERLLGIVAERHRRGVTVIMVTHDLRWVARYAQRVVVLYQGRLVAQGTARDVLADPDLLAQVGLEPLPVTALARSLRWPPPLPLVVDDMLARLGGV
jgi:energy-coupling factor transport system ATP-binding protein